jgi:hypothetical protein
MGQASGATRDEESPRQSRPLVEEAERAAASISGRLSEPEVNSREASAGAEVEEAAAPVEVRAAAVPAGTSQGAAEASSVAEHAPGRVRQRAAAVGARAGETLRPRVEKLREASVGVLDEAADDPGLRFLIVAGLLFLLFLVLWLVSYVLG